RLPAHDSVGRIRRLMTIAARAALHEVRAALDERRVRPEPRFDRRRRARLFRQRQRGAGAVAREREHRRKDQRRTRHADRLCFLGSSGQAHVRSKIMKGRDFRTQYSVQAMDLAATFNSALAKFHLMPGDYVPELTAPEGPSTGGGVQALQRLRIVPRHPAFPTLVCGDVNQKDGRAELRTWDHVDALYRQRFKRPLPIDRAQYDQFLQMAKNFLDVLRIQTVVTGPPAVLPD